MFSYDHFKRLKTRRTEIGFRHLASIFGPPKSYVYFRTPFASVEFLNLFIENDKKVTVSVRNKVKK